MFLKQFDRLSPYITLYFRGERKHSSKISGILSIITYCLILGMGINYILIFFNRQSPKAYFFNRYTEDAGNFPLNSSMMFNFIQICEQETNSPIPFDFSAIKVIGSDDVFSDEYMNNPDIILNRTHWIYEYCENEDIGGLANLIDYKNFYKSICIRKFYDKKSGKYYNTGEKGFRWPVIEKGCSHPNRTYYGIIMQRCDKVPELIRSQGIACKSESEITETISKISLKFDIIDSFADILNYKNPLTKYFYEVTSAIVNGVFIVNHLNFNPINMVTNSGFFFDDIIKELSYIFIQNEKHTIDASNLEENQTTNGCLIGIYFWMQNTLQYYERVYDKFQYILSDIGGIYSIIETAAYLINLLIHNFILILDTEDLVIIRDKNNFTERTRDKRPTILRRANKIKYPPKKKNIIYQKEDCHSSSSNYHRFLKNLETMTNPNVYIDILNKNNNSSKEKKEDIRKEGTNLIDNNNNNPISINIEQKENKILKTSGIKRPISLFKIDSITKEKINDLDNRPIEKQNFTWFKYFWYLLNLKKNNNRILYYETFRAQLISEENIIQTYLDVYKLLKYCNLFYENKEQEI